MSGGNKRIILTELGQSNERTRNPDAGHCSVCNVADNLNTTTVTGRTNVTADGRAAFKPLSMQIMEFNVVRGPERRLLPGTRLDKVIPLRKNRSSIFTATWINGDSGAIGYCEAASRNAANLEVSARFSNVAENVECRVQIFDSDGTSRGVSNAVAVSQAGEFYQFVVPNFSVKNTGFYRSSLRFEWSYRQRQPRSAAWRLLEFIGGYISVPFYNFPRIPTDPWTTVHETETRQFPWTDALDLIWDENMAWKSINRISENRTRNAFNALQGQARADTVKIAEIITRLVNGRLGLVYGLRRYTGSGSAIRLTDLMNDVNNWNRVARANARKNRGLSVDCLDCAALVTTLSNLLGCSLSNVAFGQMLQVPFRCNKVLLIGSRDDEDFHIPAEENGGFSVHVVSADVPVGERFPHETRVYDACLILDDNALVDPSQRFPVRRMPIDIQFSSQEEYSAAVSRALPRPHPYLELLLVNEPENLNLTISGRIVQRYNVR